MKILITGASGFIGRQCCAQLIAQGHEVNAKSLKNQTDDKVQWYKVDLFDSQQSIKLMRKIQPTHLLHLAWYAEPGKYWTSTKNYHWVKASLTLFEEFVKVGGTRLVVAGSCAEYSWESEKYTEDKTPLEPGTLYGVCKHSLHTMLASYASLKGLSFAWGRIFSIYGPHENPNRLFASVIQALLKDHNVKCNNGGLIRDYLHVYDVASAFIALLNSEVEGPINIGSGSGITLEDTVRKIEKKISNYGRLKINHEPISSYEAPIIIADTTRINNIGWSPLYNINHGLDNTIKWFEEK